MVSIAEITVFFPKMSQHQKQVKQGVGIVIVKEILDTEDGILKKYRKCKQFKAPSKFFK